MKNLKISIICIIFLLLSCGKIKNVTLIDLSINNISEVESSFLKDRINTKLASYQKYNLLNKETLQEYLDNNPDCLEIKCASDIGLDLHCDYVFTGDLKKNNEVYKLNIYRIDVKTQSTNKHLAVESLSLEGLSDKLDLE